MQTQAGPGQGSTELCGLAGGWGRGAVALAEGRRHLPSGHHLALGAGMYAVSNIRGFHDTFARL